MRAKGCTLLASICVFTFNASARAQVSEEAIRAFQLQQWPAVIKHLEQQQTQPGAISMLALAYFEELDYGRALPALRESLLISPDDIELNSALLEVLLVEQLNDEALVVAAHLDELGATDMAAFGRARVQLLEGDRAEAKNQLHTLVNEADPELATRSADVLIEALYLDQEFEWAHEVAQTAIRRDPDSPLAFRFSWFRPDYATATGFSTDLGYRFEYDDNVAVPDRDFASGQEDYRHVLMADVLYEHPFADGWNFYAQGHLMQSFHHDLDQFDQTRVAVSSAVGKSGRKMGWRLPVEVNHDRLDGDSFRTSITTLPGFYLQFGSDFFSHFYARIQSDDYDVFYFPGENRSGDVLGAGVLLAGNFSARFRLHSYLEFNRYDTEGLNWERDEIVAFVYGEFEFSPKWVAGLALRYQKEDFDNVRTIFAQPQKNDSKELYLNLTHNFARKWRWRGQISMVNHESNIAIYDFDRNVYSFSVAREF